MEDIYKICPICGQRATELHHIIFRSQVKALINCKYNFVYLCSECHRGSKRGIHSKNGSKLNKQLKLIFQNRLELLFTKELLSKEDIRDTLEIKDKAVDSLCKLMKSEKGMFSREDTIRTLMGGRILTDEGNVERCKRI